ncbi:hypothetical protein VV99796_00570 [Vibrio vulnificus]|nr:hypothetical protein VV93_v1c32130 [Vibrio vulnificus]OJI56311.1 hypothetical protein VFL11327_03185 [Vibrio fluvialis]OJH74022.1 hypothetical protein VVS222_03684 [Vibrio vulnificus]OJI31402.1 hypothetical protein VV99796_00570 [Vibrio vulnificus]OJI52323.1 hypothetical protein VVATL9824_00045 [Vibrio vulnificus]
MDNPFFLSLEVRVIASTGENNSEPILQKLFGLKSYAEQARKEDPH